MRNLNFMATEDFKNKRVDVFLQSCMEEKSRAAVQKLIDENCVTVNGKIVSKAWLKLKGNEEIQVNIPEEEIPELKPENIPLEIIFEDKHIAVINKPSNMTVHPAQNNYSGTLVNALLYHFDSLSNINE